jgi:hypothetical protein
VDQDISEGRHRPKPGWRQQKSCMVESFLTHCLGASMKDMTGTRPREVPQVVILSRTETGQQLAVAQYGHQFRRCRRKHIQSAVRLPHTAPHSTPEGSIIDTQPGKGRPAGGSAASFKC